MPELYFEVTWPDGERQRYYSPSLVVERHLALGVSYSVEEFLASVRSALTLASERVRAKYGFYCSAARDELARIEARAGALSPEQRGGRVCVEAFERPR